MCGDFMGELANSPIIIFLIYILAKSCDSLLLYIIPGSVERQSGWVQPSLAFPMIDVVYRGTLTRRFLGVLSCFEFRKNIVLLG